jgi:hypothetical protein
LGDLASGSRLIGLGLSQGAWKMSDMKPVSTLRELWDLSVTDLRYEKLTVLASCRLGGREELPLHDHHEWLKIYALATSEQDIVEHVNCFIPKVES